MTTSLAGVSFRAPLLPWTISEDDARRVRRITQQVLFACAVVFLVLSWLPVVAPSHAPVRAAVPPLTRLAIELPPAPPPLPMAKLKTDLPLKPAEVAPTPIKPDAALKPEARRVEPRKIAEIPGAMVPEARNPVADRPAGEIGARAKAAGMGLLAMKDELAEMHGAPVAVQLKTDIKQGPGVGTGAGVGVGAGNEAGLPARALITSNATGGSGGINTAGYSRNTGGGGLAGRATTLVEGVAGGGGGGGAGGGGMRGRDGTATGSGAGSAGGAGAGGALQRGGSGKASRSIEEIKLVFERNKGAIYAIYNRALRDEPSLQGKVVLELKIAPGGEVVDCRIVSSELHTPELEAKLLARIRQFDFGAKDVDQMVVTWPVDFLPS